MTEKIVISGTFSQATTEAFRAALPSVRVVAVSGLAGERILEVIGEFTKEQWEALRSALLSLLGEDQIKGFKVTRDSVTIEEISTERFSDAKEAALEIIDRLRTEAGN